MAFEINHYMKRKTQGNKGVAGLKIDVSKAYDRVEWGFVHSLMRRFGFHEIWIERVMKYIQSVSYTFLHNGEEFGNVIPGRGLRQGDPISPYIYILCAEGLSAIIRRNEEVGLLHGCRIARGAPVISHLLFADDCYFFFNATGSEAGVMKSILTRYADISGQVINLNKSTITFSSNTKEEARKIVYDQLGVSEVQNPGKYLGLPMRIGRKKVSEFGFLVDRIEQKLQTWNKHNISKAGKLTLLKTAAQSIPNFWMNLLLIPLDICDTIEKKMNAFWWLNGGRSGGIKWLSWDKLCEVKETGGLGVKKLREFNISMLAKQAWRLVTNTNPLVTEFMKSRYYPKTDFLNATMEENPSYVWRSIMAAQGIITQGCRKKIGDGKGTRVWQIPWLPCVQNGYLTTGMHEELQHVTVNSLMEVNNRKWDEEVLQDLFNARDKELILQVPIPIRGGDDTWFWLMDDKGSFTVKSCYRSLRGESECQERGFWNKLWNLKLPGKIINFLWRACRNVLPTTSALSKKRIDVPANCSWCHQYEEDAMHTLFNCCFAREVWEGIGGKQLYRLRMMIRS